MIRIKYSKKLCIKGHQKLRFNIFAGPINHALRPSKHKTETNHVFTNGKRHVNKQTNIIERIVYPEMCIAR